MSNLTKALILLVAILGLGAGLAFWKSSTNTHAATDFSSISKAEIEMLLADVAKVNPAAIKRLGENPELKKEQLENLKQLLSLASAAKKEGLTNVPTNHQELQNIRAEVVAVNYDKAINGDKGPMPAFGFITEDQIKQFWGEGDAAATGTMASIKDKLGLGKPDRETAFNAFLNTKVELLKASNPSMKDREISDEEKTQARDFYAKIQIYQDEFDRKAASGELDKAVVDRANLQVKLQQAQFLARVYSESLKDKLKVTDEEVDKYIAEHPEFDTTAKKAKAQEILERAKGGEDFAKLADEYSEDPGNKGPDGKGKGGLYEKINLGQMVEPFEKAALALEPGQIAPELVETDFGYHIIKLEKKGQVSDAKGADGKVAETYDARHILIATTQSDPENPMSRPMPVKQFVRQKLEAEKQKAELDKVLAENHVTVPDDFDVPQVSDEDIKKSMQGQMPNGMTSIDGDEAAPPDAAPDAKPEAKKPEAKKPEPKKK